MLPAAIERPPELGYENILKVVIVQFMDAYSFDVRSVKKVASTSHIRMDG